MRFSTTSLIAAATGLAVMPVAADAAPLRAAAALPARSSLGSAAPVRAASPATRSSSLVGAPLAIFFGVIGTVSTVALLRSGRGRSPG